MIDFWSTVEAQLDRIEAERPDTFAGVAAILAPINNQKEPYGTPADPTPWRSRIDHADRRELPDAYPESILTYGVDYRPRSAFFAGSGGDRSLWSALHTAGWRRTWSEAGYYYTAEHPATGAVLTYCEGDVFEGGAE